MNEYDEKLISFSPERLTLCCKFASPVDINPVCLQITCIKAKNIFFQDVHFIFITKIYFIMFGVRIVIKLMIFIIYVFKHIHRLITLTLFYIKAMPASFFNAISNNLMKIALKLPQCPHQHIGHTKLPVDIQKNIFLFLQLQYCLPAIFD